VKTVQAVKLSVCYMVYLLCYVYLLAKLHCITSTTSVYVVTGRDSHVAVPSSIET